MRAFFGNVWNQLKEFFGKMSKKARTMLIILAAAIVVAAIIITAVLNRTTYVLLTNEPNLTQAGEVYAAVRNMGIPVQAEGTRILVPDNRLSEVKLSLAAEGYFSDDMDYSYLDMTSGFSVTDATRQKYFEVQKAAEVRALINAVDKIQDCRVTLNIGTTSAFAFAGKGSDATASVVLMVKNGQALQNSEVQQIADIVKNSVQDLRYENITIQDSRLNMYRFGDGDGEDPADIDAELRSHIALENQLAQQIQVQGEQLLIPVFGLTNVKVQPTVRLDFDKIASESIEFAPPVAGELGGIVRSSSELYENERLPGTAGGAPGTDTNGMGPTEYPVGGLDEGGEYIKSLIEYNYEINQTITTIERALGQIKELSISVLIDSNVVEGDYTEEVTELISKAFGCDVANIAAVQLPFTYHEKSLEDMEAEWAEQMRQERMRELLKNIIMWAVILILGLALLALIRSIVKNYKEPEAAAELALAGGGVVGPGGVIDYTADGELYDEYGEEGAYDDDVELNKKSTGLEQIERFIDKDASAVAALLRNWLTDDM